MNVKYIKRDAEMDRIADAFSGYIHRHSNLDLVWSEKIGYVLMTINPDKRLGEEYCIFHTTHSVPSVQRNCDRCRFGNGKLE